MKTLVNNWLIAKLIVEENGGKFFAVLQPSSFTGNNIFHENYEMTRSDCTKDIYNEMCEMIKKEVGNKNWFLDLTNIFNNKGPYYFDGVHVNEMANEIISKEINDFINN